MLLDAMECDDYHSYSIVETYKSPYPVITIYRLLLTVESLSLGLQFIDAALLSPTKDTHHMSILPGRTVPAVTIGKRSIARTARHCGDSLLQPGYVRNE